VPETLDEATCVQIRAEFEQRDLTMVGVSATYNTIHPDESRRAAETARARRVIELAPALGTDLVTLCTGTRDPEDMWRAHPGNEAPEAWDDLLVTLEVLHEAAQAAGVYLGVEPEAANVVSSAARARDLVERVGMERIRIVLDPANLLTAGTLGRQDEILTEAFELLTPYLIQVHAKDIDEGGHLAAGRGRLDYGLYFRLLAERRVTVPVIMHELEEDDASRARDFVARHRDNTGWDD
jgi:sugar phosphate isomerase/epimerase